MKAKQVIFKDGEGALMAGIMVDNRFVICGCCGNIFDLRQEPEIMRKYKLGPATLVKELSWIPITEEIGGDELIGRRRVEEY